MVIYVLELPMADIFEGLNNMSTITPLLVYHHSIHVIDYASEMWPLPMITRESYDGRNAICSCSDQCSWTAVGGVWIIHLSIGQVLHLDYKSRRQTLWVTRVRQGFGFWIWMMSVGLTQCRVKGQGLGFSPSVSSRWGCLSQEVLTVDYRTCEQRIDNALVTIQ